jgi:hypothetical protein
VANAAIADRVPAGVIAADVPVAAAIAVNVADASKDRLKLTSRN